jgi:hypothetical protein
VVEQDLFELLYRYDQNMDQQQVKERRWSMRIIATLMFGSAAKPPVLKSVRIRVGGDFSVAAGYFSVKVAWSSWFGSLGLF